MADLLKRKSAGLAFGRTLSYFGAHRYDPANTFDWLMKLSEQAGVTSAFFFITDHSAGEIDGHYSFRNPFRSELIRRDSCAGT